MSAVSRPTLFLVDATHHLYRAYFAIKKLSTSNGVPTNAVYGFVSTLKRIIATYQPVYLACCFDKPGETFRHKLYRDYKGQREEMPDDLVEQIPRIKRFCEAMRIPVLEKEGFEADDVIGTLARQGVEHGLDVVIVSNDKDLFQLVRSGVRILYLDRKEGERLLDESGVEEVFGVKPSQVADVLALWGDPTDNIPGVPGIGEKGAKDIIRECGSLEDALRRSDEISIKRYRGKIAPHSERAHLSKRLATICDDVGIPWDVEALRLGNPDEMALQAFYREHEFRGLLEKNLKHKIRNAEETSSDDSQPSQSPPPSPTVIHQPSALSPSSIIPLDSRAWQRLHAEVANTHRVSILLHPPAGGFSLTSTHLLFTVNGEAVFSLSLNGEENASRAKEMLRDTNVLKIGHDIKRLLLFYPETKPPFADPMVAAYVLDSENGNYSIKALARRYFSMEIDLHENTSEKGLFDSERNPVDRSASWVRITPLLWDKISTELARHQILQNLYETLELPLTRVLAAMERRGVMVDANKLAKLGAELEADIQQLEKEIHALAGEDFNIASSRQLGSILYEKLRLTVRKKTAKTRAASTDTEALEMLVAEHPIAQKVLDYRQKTKLKNTYTDALLRLIHPQTGRIHTSYNQCVTATGRLSSSEPNLQNIPIRTVEGKKIREAFVAPPGFVFVSADYSQIELRILAHLSDDETLIRAFERGEDIHARTAIEIMGVAEDAVNNDVRRAAKTVNFGVIYGMSAFGLAKQLGVSSDVAKGIIDTYFGRYEGVARLKREILAQARETGFVRTLFGRSRYIPNIRDKNRTVREAAERAAFNTPIQGSAADIMKRAMLQVYGFLEKRDDAFLVMQVHDELVIEAREDEAKRIAAEVKRLMESAFPLRVSLTVDVKTGKTWA